MDTRLASAIRRAIIANQSRSRFDFSAIVFSAKSCARRRTHHEREMIYSRVNQYTPVVFAERIERLVQTFPTRRISKDRLRPVICCSRFAGINFYGLVSPFLYGSPPRELPCVIDGGRAHAGKPRLESLETGFFSSFSLFLLFFLSSLLSSLSIALSSSRTVLASFLFFDVIEDRSTDDRRGRKFAIFKNDRLKYDKVKEKDWRKRGKREERRRNVEESRNGDPIGNWNRGSCIVVVVDHLSSNGRESFERGLRFRRSNMCVCMFGVYKRIAV